MSEEKKNEVSQYTTKKSNTLIQSKYKVTILGHKLMAFCLFYLQKGECKKKGDHYSFQVPAEELKKYFKWSGNSFYKNLSKAASSLKGYELIFKDPEKQEFSYKSIFPDITFSGGILDVEFGRDLDNYIVALEKNYTIVNLPLMLKWQRSYTFRVFELLLSEAYRFKDNDYNCIFETNLAEFKFQIGCYDVDWPAPKEVLGKKNLTAEDYEAAELAILKDYEKNKSKGIDKHKKIKQYFVWGQFNERVLKPAIEEINSTEEADMYIDRVETLKKGRGGKVYAIRIHYRTHLNSSNEDTPDVVDNIELTEEEKVDFVMDLGLKLAQYGLKAKDVRSIAERANWNMFRCDKALEVLEKTDNVENVISFLNAAIDGDWDPPVSKKDTNNKDSFTNIEKHDYDFEALEKDLLCNNVDDEDNE